MTTALQMRDVLQKMNLGNSVAEFDDSLERYFVETEPFRALLLDRVDLIAGDKGTGKTAIFRTLRARYASLPELKGVEVIPAFNPTGNPVFQRLAHEKVLTEAQYISVWKAFFMSLVGNWLMDIFGPASTNLKSLDAMLRETALRSEDDAPTTVFSKLMNMVRRVLHPESAELQFTFSESGIPILIPKVKFGSDGASAEPVKVIPHEDALRLLNRCLAEQQITAWIALDRLDEAFQGFPDVETPALRALLRTYLDLLEFDRVRLKLFVRRDLFRKIVRDGFVNLTHVNARKIEIIWDEDDLLNLLCRRLRQSADFIGSTGLKSANDKQLFGAVFPEQIELGERRPTAWSWMMSRIRDGNNIKPPRNLIDLVSKSREAQLRREQREARPYASDVPIIEAEAIKRGLERLSADRVEDTLLAEAGDAGPIIERFRKGKSEYDPLKLAALLGVPNERLASAVKPLLDIGFLEKVGDNYKIPLLYREGLEISQGKAT